MTMGMNDTASHDQAASLPLHVPCPGSSEIITITNRHTSDFNFSNSLSSSSSLTNMDFSPSLPKLAYHFNHEKAEESAKVILCHFRPELQKQLESEKLIVKEFTGGVTNKLLAAYFASDKAKKTLIRVYGAETDKIIDRAGEIRTLLTLNEHQCCGKLFGVFDNGMCYEFVSGQPLTLDTVRHEEISRLIIEELVKLHCVYREGEDLEVMDIFGKMSCFLELLPSSYQDKEKERKFKEYYPDPQIFAREFESLKVHFADADSPLVFCHNDLLCANILFDKEKGVNFIDFEYAGLNFQAFDIANHFNEFAGVDDCDYRRYPSRQFQITWLTYYLECWKKAHNDGNSKADGEKTLTTDEAVQSLYVVVKKYTLLSHLFWILWTLIQAEHSQIDFDFLSYGKIRFDEYTRRKEELLKPKLSSSSVPESTHSN